LTPDSFYDGGKYNEISRAVDATLKMVQDGADVIDIGGYSTRPGHSDVSPQVEIERVLPVLQAIRQKSDVLISIDTFRADVADIMLYNGADIVNDVWGLKHDAAMASVVAKHRAIVCIMHNRDNCQYDDIVQDILRDLQSSIKIALSHGIQSDQIILDPGIGFGKNAEQSLNVMQNLKQLKSFGYVWMLAASNKSLFGLVGLDKYQRLEGTIASSVHASACGFDYVRVHDVLPNKRALVVADALYKI
jgi:dihydropteroate synthase